MENEKIFEWIEFSAPDNIEKGSGETLEIPIRVKNIQPAKRKFNIDINYSIDEKDDTVEWKSILTVNKNLDLNLNGSGQVNESFEVDGNKEKTITIKIFTPKGAFANDRLSMKFSIASEDMVHSFTKSIIITLKPVIIALKTVVGSEIPVAMDLNNKAERDRVERSKQNEKAISEILAIMAPYEVKGYIFVETMHPDRVSYLARDVRGFKGVVAGKISIDEIAHYLTPKPAVSGLELGSLVELVEGPFKGEKAKIMSIDSVKEEVTVQLVESMVPIPVTVKAESIRTIK
ncbi:MAG: transcription elongation factor Spt5 [Thermoplasmata archaeon]